MAKGKMRPRTDRERPEREQSCSSTLSLTSAVDGRRWLTSRSGLCNPGNETKYSLYKDAGWAPGPLWTGAANSPPTGNCFSVLCYFLCTSFVFGFLSWLSCILPFCLYLNNTNIHTSGGIPTHNPCRRRATDVRTRPRGHRDRHSNPGPSSP